MQLAQVSNHLHVGCSAEQENLWDRVRSYVSNLSRIITEELELLHLLHVLQHLVLLRQEPSHALLNHVASRHVSSNPALKDHRVLLDQQKDLTHPSHPEV